MNTQFHSFPYFGLLENGGFVARMGSNLWIEEDCQKRMKEG